MRKILLTLFLLLAIAGTAYAQQYGYNRVRLKQSGMLLKQRASNFTATLGVGAHELMADGQPFNPSLPSLGAHIELGYTHLLNRYWGIHAALGISFGRSTVNFDTLQTISIGQMPLFDEDGSYQRSAHVITRGDNLRDNFNIIYLTLPIMAQYQNDHFIMAAGLRFMLPVSASANYTYDTASLSYGPQIDGMGVTLHAPIDYRTISARDGKYDLKNIDGLKNMMTFNAAIELGYRYATSNENQFIITFYAEVGLNKISTGGEQGLVDVYDNQLHFNQLLNSNAIHDLRYISLGLRLKYNISFGNNLKIINPYKITGLRWKYL